MILGEILLVVLLGLAVGSFLNVVIWRLPAGEKFWRGRSFCPHCRQVLLWRDLVPLLSFIWRRGRCRYCAQKISWQYPLVEAATAGLFVAAYGFWGLSWPGAANLFFLLVLLVILVQDLRYYLILDAVTVPAMVVAFLVNLALGRSGLDLVVAAAVGGGFFALQYWWSRGRWVGSGDIRLGALLGLMLGSRWLFLTLLIGYVGGAVISLPLLLTGRKKLNSALPLGVFLSAAAAVSLFFGPALWQFYLNLMGYGL